MHKTIRIGTRDSQLALWQAHTVQQRLEDLGYATEIVAVKSTGDLILDKPLYELGITGIFTKTLDVAMLNGTVDIAVHSMKDVPTLLPQGIIQTAVLERANVNDILVHKGLDFLNAEGTVATGSLRRKAQWLNRYPNHKVDDLRGNVITRLQKLEDNPWNAAVFAKAGLERINVLPEHYIELDWMIPAPAQGAMVVVTLEKDKDITEAVSKLNDTPTDICTHVEREFLRILEAGCTAPIGGLATITNDTIAFTGILLALDGSKKLSISKTDLLSNYKGFGKRCALELIEKGGKELMDSIKKEMNS
ncbi:porphobilinogen deaminase [Formosa agariphila KMM 3901]|uniref:Hydroxymethylbilane synthase n=1 Tax=Formosa agariphila (strain DSM 15362 / KCTC 12365 / LMG 23005 / KMM 3901 / M-2Alg 35-1) TaxID=1347342 RepID=T2KRP4_FORAG|nr:hydroxymethylbilane synthase [Formosa agariphila]CDF81136.1 porphobilinogen deaminase [Formosa agariphila KMM 3901]